MKIDIRAPRSRRFRRAIVAVAATAALLFAPLLAAQPASAASNQRVLNAYAYLSDAGAAEFRVNVTSGGNITTSGVLWYYTSPGVAGSTFSWGGAQSKAVSTDAPGADGNLTLPAYAAGTAAEQIGVWIRPQGSAIAPGATVRLQTNPAHANYVGVIRPLKVAIAAPTGLGCILSSTNCISTLRALTVSSTADSAFPVTSVSGVAPVNTKLGSCVNYDGNGSGGATADSTMRTCAVPGGAEGSGGILRLIDAGNAAVTSLPMLDASGAQIGQWTVAADNQSISWNITADPATVTSVQPVKYQQQDYRGRSWSGWWEQGLTVPENVLAGPATYDTAELIPQISASAASAAEATVTTNPEVPVTLTPVYSAGTDFRGTASTATVTVTPADSTQGTWSVNADGTISFAPNATASGHSATATYRVTSSNGTFADAQLTVNVLSAAIRASVGDAESDTDPATTATLLPTFSPGTMIGGASATATFAIIPDDPSQGTWAVDANGQVTFTPAAGVSGVRATAKLRLTSSNGTFAASTVAVDVRSAAIPASVSKAQVTTDPTVTATLKPVFSPGTLIGGAPATASFAIIPDDPSQGAWAVSANGQITFTPAAGVAGVRATAKLRLTSSNGTFAEATIEVDVNAPAPEPTPATSSTGAPAGSPPAHPSGGKALSLTGANVGGALTAGALAVATVIMGVALAALRVARRRAE